MIDEKLYNQFQKVCRLLQSSEGQRLVELAPRVINGAPGVLSMISEGNSMSVTMLYDLIQAMLSDESHTVSGFEMPPSNGIISLAWHMSGNSPLSTVSNSAAHFIASVPVIGSISGLRQSREELQNAAALLRVRGVEPTTKKDWETAAKALTNAKALHAFDEEHKQYGSVVQDVSSSENKLRELESILVDAVELTKLVPNVDALAEAQLCSECRFLDLHRTKITSQIKRIGSELVAAKVLAELCASFSPEAQSALIQFSQVAGKTRFSRSQPSKMSTRQKRRRQEYLDAFNKCCRFIPCWILTTSQISDYLPVECLFDLVIVDEASQSDATVLPALLRAKQWCIVGDRNQVSPTECFVSEDSIESLRAALPSSPLQSSLLPGQSFFDLCSQAFPTGRVRQILIVPVYFCMSLTLLLLTQTVLAEHFRCAEEIIAFSNEQFYDGRLVPLRLPTQSERLTPALVDVRVNNGEKTGKVNEAEADEIARLIQDFVSSCHKSTAAPLQRTIGVISLMGDEQSRLIRRKLLNSLGPEKMAFHDILVGDPPTFQGAERDVIYLSMVCSKGNVPTQNQMMHYQRANVAMSRARDRCVLVRSIDLVDVPSRDDVKLPIIEFFQTFADKMDDDESEPECGAETGGQQRATHLLEKCLKDRGFAIRSMGVVWPNAICIEHGDSDIRAAMLVDCEGGSPQEWQTSYARQKAIERVGWKCLRMDALSLLIDHDRAIKSILGFLADIGIKERPVIEQEAIVNNNDDGHGVLDPNGNADQPHGHYVQEVISICTDDEDGSPATKNGAIEEPTDSWDEEDATKFGQVVHLNFLRGGETKADDDIHQQHNEESSDESDPPPRKRSNLRVLHDEDDEDEDDDDDSSKDY
jgi:hypothetical protein